MSQVRNLYSDGKYTTYPEGETVLDMIPMLFIDNINDRSHTVVQDDTLTSLAHFYYKDSRQWWKIAQKNDLILDDPFALEVGIELIIPYLD